MRLTPAQIGVCLICGKELPFKPVGKTIQERIVAGHDMLVRISGKDFGYDLAAWHAYLKESRDGGYTYGRNIVLPKLMNAALTSQEWQVEVSQIQAGRIG